MVGQPDSVPSPADYAFRGSVLDNDAETLCLPADLGLRTSVQPPYEHLVVGEGWRRTTATALSMDGEVAEGDDETVGSETSAASVSPTGSRW